MGALTSCPFPWSLVLTLSLGKLRPSRVQKSIWLAYFQSLAEPGITSPSEVPEPKVAPGACSYHFLFQYGGLSWYHRALCPLGIVLGGDYREAAG